MVASCPSRSARRGSARPPAGGRALAESARGGPAPRATSRRACRRAGGRHVTRRARSLLELRERGRLRKRRVERRPLHLAECPLDIGGYFLHVLRRDSVLLDQAALGDQQRVALLPAFELASGSG